MGKPKKETFKGRRRILGRADRLLTAICMARRRIKDDLDFVEKVNAILHYENLVPREEFGIFSERKKND